MTKAIINTRSGIEIDLLNPSPEQIIIEDIAHGLSMLCRFNGHCKEFYSVAEHSVLVSYEIEPKLALIGLLHDAAEAYLGDVPSPLKEHLPEFGKIEENMLRVIAERFEIAPSAFEPRLYHEADKQLFAEEWEALMDEPCPGKDPSRIQALSHNEAHDLFLARFRELTA